MSEPTFEIFDRVRVVGGDDWRFHDIGGLMGSVVDTQWQPSRTTDPTPTCIVRVRLDGRGYDVTLPAERLEKA